MDDTRVWSNKQTAIFKWFADIVTDIIEHLVVRARAGTGKTSTIVEALRHIPKGLNVLVCAFGKDIKIELESRLIGVPGVTVKTIHAVGLACVKRFWPDVKINYSSDREDDLAQRVCGSAAPDAIKKLVAKLCTKGRLVAPHATRLGDLTEVALEFECDPDEEWTACRSCGGERDDITHDYVERQGRHPYNGFDLAYVEKKALEAMELAASEKPVRTGIDGADMIFLPVRNHWLRKTYDVVVIDEAQDMNACQLEITQGVCRGRIIVVGDDRQAIFAFAGADSGSLDRLKVALNAREMPLNVTYRCGTAIVEAAQYYVPDFVAGPNNPTGSVTELNSAYLTANAEMGDYILSRVNAPLVSVAMSLLRSGKRTRIAGRNIGEGLVKLVNKMKARSVPDLLRKIAAWETREANRLEAKFKGKTSSSTFQAKLDGIHDQAEMLGSLTNGATNVDEVTARIEALFTDDGLGEAGVITCSSVHKAKGKEANRVFVLRDTLRETTDEERNICYVAITRAKNALVWVSDKAPLEEVA